MLHRQQMLKDLAQRQVLLLNLLQENRNSITVFVPAVDSEAEQDLATARAGGTAEAIPPLFTTSQGGRGGARGPALHFDIP